MKVGIVLSGGMAKGAYQVGALKAISNYIDREELMCVSGSSIGVLNGYSYLAGTLDRSEKLWKGLCDGHNRLFIGQILRNGTTDNIIKTIYNPDYKFDSKFYCALFDFSVRNIVYKDLSAVDSDTMLRYLKAGVSLPIYNKAVKINNHMYFDGAMVDNIPVYPLKEQNLDLIICIYFDDVSYKFENDFFDKKIIKITFPSSNGFNQSMVFRQDRINEMLKTGFSTTSFILDTVFSKGKGNLDEVYGRIREMNRIQGKSSLRVTVDMIATNINKVTKRILKQKID